MNWWLKSRSIVGFAVTAVFTAITGLVVGDAELPVPSITGQAGTFLSGHLITVLPAVVLMHDISRGDVKSERIAARPINRWDAALGLSCAAFAALSPGLAYLISREEIAMVIGRNMVAYIGMAMLLAAFLGGRSAALATTLVPVTLSTAGWAPGNVPQPWAWVLHSADSLIALALTLAVLGAGAGAMCLRSAPIRKLRH
ncbi:hypothetical protein ACH4E8_21915 [Streptomyces sp. NPDC017979]|uniref:hypothetical protein n=1 Tax=Streptomyces sp. NPDC017979 TaxID=3365024 RepID=UPI0037BA0EED